MQIAKYLALLLGLLSVPAMGAVKGMEVNYQIDGASYTGYIAYDDALEGQRPGILVVHEWWGHNQYARHRAEMLAEMGYTALALDMYGSGKLANHPEDAKKFMSAVMGDLAQVEQRFNAALDLLKQEETVNPEQTAAIGYCMGGGIVLGMAKMGTELDGVVSFHGSLGPATKIPRGEGDTRMLILNGAADPFVPAEQVAAFESEMQAQNMDYQLHNYPGVKHSFTNPDADAFGEKFQMPLAYDKAADDDSWQRMQVFLQGLF